MGLVIRLVVEDDDTLVSSVVYLLNLGEVDHSIVPLHEDQVAYFEGKAFLTPTFLARHGTETESNRKMGVTSTKDRKSIGETSGE